VIKLYNLFWLDGSQTVLAYSTIGLTIAVYAADFTGFVQSLRFRQINPSILFCHQNSTKNKQVRQTSYKLHGHTLDNVEASKYLGITINNKLSWDRHIENIFGKGNKMLGFICRNLKASK
jgi:hypothetical protein